MRATKNNNMVRESRGEEYLLMRSYLTGMPLARTSFGTLARAQWKLKVR